MWFIDSLSLSYSPFHIYIFISIQPCCNIQYTHFLSIWLCSFLYHNAQCTLNEQQAITWLLLRYIYAAFILFCSFHSVQMKHIISHRGIYLMQFTFSCWRQHHSFGQYTNKYMCCTSEINVIALAISSHLLFSFIFQCLWMWMNEIRIQRTCHRTKASRDAECWFFRSKRCRNLN